MSTAPPAAHPELAPGHAPLRDPAPDTQASRLIVGPNIKLKGAEITDCDTLIVEGRVEATMDSRVIQIAETGVFTGKVAIDIAEIRSEFQGELTVRDRLTVHATGRITGRVQYGKLVVEEGARLSGDISRIDDSLGERQHGPLMAVRG